MNKIVLINPDKTNLITIPLFLKDYYIGKKFKTLPNNNILKLIYIFFYMKILRFPRKIVQIFLSAKFNIKLPAKKKYLIFDDICSDLFIGKFFEKEDCFELAVRFERIKNICINWKIILYILKNFFKLPLKLNYLSSIILIISPKKIVTSIDNSTELNKIAKFLKNEKIEFIVVQNSSRTIVQEAGKEFEDRYIPNYFTIGEYEKKLFKKSLNNKKILKINSVGSIRAGHALNNILKSNVSLKKDSDFDLCLLSEPHVSLSGDFPDFPEYSRYVGLITSHCINYAKNNSKKLIILGKSDIDDDELKTLEILYYKKIVKDFNFKITFNKKNKFENYLSMINSKLTIGINSTMLREAFIFNRKILWCGNITKYEPLKFMTEGICVLEGLTYKSFENKVNELLEINYDEYLDKIQNHSSIITINNTFELLNKAITK